MSPLHVSHVSNKANSLYKVPTLNINTTSLWRFHGVSFYSLELVFLGNREAGLVRVDVY